MFQESRLDRVAVRWYRRPTGTFRGVSPEPAQWPQHQSVRTRDLFPRSVLESGDQCRRRVAQVAASFGPFFTVGFHARGSFAFSNSTRHGTRERGSLASAPRAVQFLKRTTCSLSMPSIVQFMLCFLHAHTAPEASMRAIAPSNL